MTADRQTRWGAGLAFLACALAQAACAPQHRSPCASLVYSEGGLTRSQYAPCAKAMVAGLDRMHAALQVVGDAGVSPARRREAQHQCFAAGHDLARLIAEAGGSEKLLRMSWEDRELSSFNDDVEAARTSYTMLCYYGLTGPDVVRMDRGHASARALAASLP